MVKDIRTKRDYKEFEDTFESFMQREGINNLSVLADFEEPYFSWHRCEVCDRDLGGDRWDMNGYNPKTKEVQGPYSVCVDCMYYAEYGKLDDMTMADLY